MREYKLVVLGVGGVGKSALTVQYVEGVFVTRYDRTIEDTYRIQVDIDGQQRTLEILDSAGTEQFTNMLDLLISTGEGFVLVYSINSQSTLKDLRHLRHKIVTVKDTEDIPMVLVGNKCDLENEREVSRDLGRELAHQWGNIPFIESSAKSKMNVSEIFKELVRQVDSKRLVKPRKLKRRRRCVIL